MKKFSYIIPLALLVLSACKQTEFIAEDDVYSYRDPMLLRPKSSGVTPEASLDGYVYNQENGSRSTFYDPKNDLKKRESTDSDQISNTDFYSDPWGYNYSDPRMRPFGSPMMFMGYGWNSPWRYNAYCGNYWGWNSFGPTYPWGFNPYGYFHQPYGGFYGPWGVHGGSGWQSQGYWGNNGFGGMGWGNQGYWGNNGFGGMGWGNQGFWSNSGFFNSGSAFSGTMGSTQFGPRPNISSSYNPNNLNVGRGNISPIGSNGQPINSGGAVTSDRGVSRETIVAENGARNSGSDRQVLSSNSSPWNPRVDGKAETSSGSINRGNNSGSVTVSRGNVNNSNTVRHNGVNSQGINGSSSVVRTSTSRSDRPVTSSPSGSSRSNSGSAMPSENRTSFPSNSNHRTSNPTSGSGSINSRSSFPSTSPSSSGGGRGGFSGSSGGASSGGSSGGSRSSGGSAGGSRGGRP
jgi:hypothetical protein